MRGFILICLLTCSHVLFAQKTQEVDTLSYTYELYEKHSPKKATIRSAIIPGWGQAYNKKYWKMPIVYAGLGTCIYFIVDNTKQYNDWKTLVIAEEDDDPTTINTTQASSAQLRDQMNFYARWRDIAYLSLAGVYILNVIDAHVDGYLYHFEVNEDLTAGINPYATYSPWGNSAGLSLTLTFK